MRMRFLAILLAFISLPLAASITGVVINGDGQPVAGATVVISAPETAEARQTRLASSTPERAALATATTDSKGTFKLDAPQGQPVVILTVQAAGFAPEGIRLLADDDAGAIALAAAPMKRGTITANGKPLAGASVVWMGYNADFLVKTDADGRYSVPDPSKWANRTIVVHPDFAPVDEVLPPRTTTPRLDYALNAGVTVSGKVVAADGKTAVAKAPVTIDDMPAAVTADDGSFTIAHAPSNWQELQARSGNFAGIRARSANGAVTIRMASVAKVTGVVRDAKSQLPLASAEVRLGPEMMAFGRRQMRAFSAMGGGAATESAITDAKGNFSITAAPGKYTLTAVYPSATVSQSQISLTAGQTLNKPLFTAAQGRVTGTVVDENRRPLSAAHVAAESVRRGGMMPMMITSNQPADGYSGPDGRFVLRSVQTDADIEIAAQKKGFPQAHSSSMKLVSGEKKSGITITIPRGVALSGRVTDANGKPVSGVRVDPVEAQGGMRGGMVRRVVNMMARERTDDLVTTASDGTFTVRVKPATYDVVFKREGFATKVLHSTSIDATSKPVEVKLDPSVEISGRVVRNGTGVEGVMVNAMSEDGPATTTTNSDGSFALTDLTPGQMMLNLMKPDAFIQQIRSVTAPAANLVIELPAGGRIVGHVVDKATHNPVTAFEAGIAFQRGAGGMMIALPPMLKDFTSDDGSFTLENVPPGPTQLVVSAPGYSTARVPGLNVEDGKALDNVEVDLDTGVRLTGRVIGPDGSPVAGATIREVLSGSIRGVGPGGGGANATSDPNGEYTIDSLDPGDKTFTFSHQGYQSVDKTITLSGREARLDAQLGAGMTISGTVVTDAGAPVPDATVNAMSASNSGFGTPNATTDAGGNFQMIGVAPGHYTFMARKDGVGQGQLRDVDVTTTAPRIVIPASGTIVGHVTGLTDSDLQNTTVFANGQSGSASASPDSTGAYRIDGAPTGTVHVTARTGRGFGPGGKSSGMVSVEVDPGSTATANIQFQASTIVSGRVTRNGQPMANVLVSFNPRAGNTSGSSSGNTDGNGSYSISGLDDGSYNVGVLDIDRSTAFSSTYEVHGSGTFDIDIKTTSLRGTVVDSSTGQPIPAATIQLQNQQGGFLGSRTVQSDPSGAFFVENVARGAYNIVVQKDGYGHGMRNITVGDTAPDDLQFKLAPSAGITISVVDERDNRQISASASRVVDASGNVVTPEGGFFMGGGSPEPIKLTVAPGQYTVTITAMGYATKVMTVTSPSSITVALSPGVTIQLLSSASTPVRARLVDGSGAIYRSFMLDPTPLTTTVNNVAPGSYTLQVLDNNGNVVKAVPVTITDGATPIKV